MVGESSLARKKQNRDQETENLSEEACERRETRLSNATILLSED